MVYQNTGRKVMSKKDDVLEDLKKKIVAGEITPGSWITEREIGEMYAMSRTPVREILWNLATLNIIEAAGDRGYRVIKYTIEDIIEVFNARKAIEGECARLACLSSDVDYASRVQSLQEELSSTEAGEDPARLIEIGSRVHQFIQEKANNRYLSAFNIRIYSLVGIIRNTTKAYVAIEDESKLGHQKILEALAARDGLLCAQAMRQHLHSTCVAVVKFDCNNLLGVDEEKDLIFREGENV
jgi:DNA-binding GntR family transcriptional regulator